MRFSLPAAIRGAIVAVLALAILGPDFWSVAAVIIVTCPAIEATIDGRGATGACLEIQCECGAWIETPVMMRMTGGKPYG